MCFTKLMQRWETYYCRGTVKEIEIPQIRTFANYKIKSGISCTPYVPLFSPHRNKDKIDNNVKLIKYVPSSTGNLYFICP